ncbi:hypothetical protein HY969_01560 [Candidatus Kaiserbacteria bacterium]|nr:hypothetical protein [Candidatus Kaiserbacteria bacterium]
MQKKQTLQSAIFLGRKEGALGALQYLLQQKVAIKMVVNPGGTDLSLRSFAQKHKIRFLTDDRMLYRTIERKDASIRADLVISYLYPKKIRRPLIEHAKLGCINFHPAPLPEYRGRAGYNTAILEKKKRFGVSAHVIDSETFDSGPIIEVLRFRIDPSHESVLSLERLTQKKLLELFKIVIARYKKGAAIKTKQNRGGLYLTAEGLESMKRILPSDSAKDIHRKIRAFFFPPYRGATIEIKGETFTLVDDEMLSELGKLLKTQRHV